MWTATGKRLLACQALAVLLAGGAHGQKFHVYVGEVQADSAVIAWGTTAGERNTIGRVSASHGGAIVKWNGRAIAASANWARLEGLEPDREYPYEVILEGQPIGRGSVRTLPAASRQLAFFVIGDYGTGGQDQRRIAAAMAAELEKRRSSSNPVRFVLTTGDNIYANTLFGIPASGSGDEDRHWGRKFFEPYRGILAAVPFYPSPGNHDGNESESAGDLPVYLDNFFFPGGRPARYYRFSYGGLADFFSLDTTENTLGGFTAPFYTREGEQFRWLAGALKSSTAPWKIAYFHHPPFTGGPHHPPSLPQLGHIVELLGQHRVRAVFTGHEHNFQFSLRNQQTRGIQWVVSGAGGQRRRQDIRRNMEAEQIAGWAPERHFLLVEIEDLTMRITPLGDKPVLVRDKNGRMVPMPLVVDGK